MSLKDKSIPTERTDLYPDITVWFAEVDVKVAVKELRDRLGVSHAKLREDDADGYITRNIIDEVFGNE